MIKCYHLAPATQDPSAPLHLDPPSSVVAVATVISDLQRSVTSELFEDAGAPLRFIPHSHGERCVLWIPEGG